MFESSRECAVNGSFGSLKHLRVLFAAVAVLLASAAGAQAQTGSVKGVLRDGSGGVLPGVTVTLIPENAGAQRSAVTGNDGQYEFAQLPPGSYTVRAALPGFSEFEKLNVSVSGMPVVVDATLAVAALTDSVTVDAQMDRFKVLPARPTNSLFGSTSRSWRFRDRSR